MNIDDQIWKPASNVSAFPSYPANSLLFSELMVFALFWYYSSRWINAWPTYFAVLLSSFWISVRLVFHSTKLKIAYLWFLSIIVYLPFANPLACLNHVKKIFNEQPIRYCFRPFKTNIPLLALLLATQLLPYYSSWPLVHIARRYIVSLPVFGFSLNCPEPLSSLSLSCVNHQVVSSTSRAFLYSFSIARMCACFVWYPRSPRFWINSLLIVDVILFIKSVISFLRQSWRLQ